MLTSVNLLSWAKCGWQFRWEFSRDRLNDQWFVYFRLNFCCVLWCLGQVVVIWYLSHLIYTRNVKYSDPYLTIDLTSTALLPVLRLILIKFLDKPTFQFDVDFNYIFVVCLYWIIYTRKGWMPAFCSLWKLNRCRGTISVYQNNVSKNKVDLKQAIYKDIDKRYFDQLIQLKVNA